MEIYRYRPYNEYDKIGLENSEIYFPELSQLNDPMEGYTDIYFQGDKIIWTNLFRNYLRSLFEAFLFAQISRPLPEAPEDLFSPIIPFHLWPDEQFEKIQFLDWFHSLPQQFISQQAVKSLIENIANKHITREQLLFFLKVIHFIALHIIIQYMIDNQLLESSQNFISQDFQNEVNWGDFFSSNSDEKIGDISSFLNQISYGSLRRFEEKGDISFDGFIRIVEFLGWRDTMYELATRSVEYCSIRNLDYYRQHYWRKQCFFD